MREEALNIQHGLPVPVLDRSGEDVVTGHYFLSYSSVDGENLALALADALTPGPPPVTVWLAARDIRPGEDWDEQVVEAIRNCQALLLLLTEDSVKPGSVCKNEWVRALTYKKNI